MPLKLDIKSGEKMIVNGVVLENVGPNAKLLIRNKAAILRESEILAQSEAVTPASRVYFSLQCAYIFPEARETHIKNARQFLRDYREACPSAEDITDTILEHIETEEYYRGLKAARQLIGHEISTLSEFQTGLSRLEEIAVVDVDSEDDGALALDSDDDAVLDGPRSS